MNYKVVVSTTFFVSLCVLLQRYTNYTKLYLLVYFFIFYYIYIKEVYIMPSITDIFAEVSSTITSFIGALGQAMNSVTSLFWDATANSGAGQFTFLGVLILIGVGVGLVYLCYRVIKGLLHRV